VGPPRVHDSHCRGPHQRADQTVLAACVRQRPDVDGHVGGRRIAGPVPLRTAGRQRLDHGAAVRQQRHAHMDARSGRRRFAHRADVGAEQRFDGRRGRRAHDPDRDPHRLGCPHRTCFGAPGPRQPAAGTDRTVVHDPVRRGHVRRPAKVLALYSGAEPHVGDGDDLEQRTGDGERLHLVRRQAGCPGRHSHEHAALDVHRPPRHPDPADQRRRRRRLARRVRTVRNRVHATDGRQPPPALRFPGQEADAADGERSYNIFRWYRSGWGRYTQGDPLGVDGGDTHVYRYTSASTLPR
jgi:RHS repeat-associated protein